VKVVFPMAGLNVSGGVKNLLLQAVALAGAGHDVRVIVPDFAARAPFPLDRTVRVDVVRTGGSRPRYYAYLARNAARDADVCVVAYYPTVWCAVLSRLWLRQRTRVLYSVAAYEPVTHGLLAPASRLSRLGRAALAWLSYRLPTFRVYASAWLRDQVGDASGLVIGRGLDLSTFSPLGRDESARVRVGAIGRTGAVKGYATLLAALSGMSAPISLRVVALDDVEVPGERLPPQDEAGMAAFYRSCDVFVFTSVSEGFPAPPLEAMACGCAVVTTDCGGVREYAVPDVNCVTVSPGDVAGLRAALERVARDAGLRRSLASAGVETARRFDRQHMLRCFVDLID
jgi:glycosyltransferase involved in cell wall biosynthesis